MNIPLAAEQGDASALHFLGIVAYGPGKGKPKNPVEAERLFRLAAEQGYAPAQSELGYMYRYGKGVRQNYVEAVRWYRLAAEQGDAEAKYALREMYENSGEMLLNDAEAAAHLCRFVAEQGDADAQCNLGHSYRYGEGVSRDDFEAYIWYSLANSNGIGSAAFERDKVAACLSPADLVAAQREAAHRFKSMRSPVRVWSMDEKNPFAH